MLLEIEILVIARIVPNECTLSGSFMFLLQAFGQSFLRPDITIFKQNLEALENLNSKCKLYQKVRVQRAESI